MPLTDQELLEQLTLRYQVEFNTSLVNAGEYSLDDIVKIIPPNQMLEGPGHNEVTFVWTDGTAKLTEFKGEVPFHSLPVYSRSIAVKRYVYGLQESLHNLRKPHIRALYDEHIRTWVAGSDGILYTRFLKAWQRILRGDTLEFGAARDKQPLFDENHPGADSHGNPRLHSNLFNLALNETNLETIVAEMQEYRHPSGRSYGNKWRSSAMTYPQNRRDEVSPVVGPSFHLTVGPKLAATAARLAAMNRDNPSPFAGTFTCSTNAEFTGEFEGHWTLRWLDDSRKPLNLIDSGAQMTVADGYGSEPGRKHGRAEWILWAAEALQYDDWSAIALSKGGQ